MIRGLWTAASGMTAQQMGIDVTANNLANANTTGFKKSRSNFQDMMYQTLVIAGAETPAGGQIPVGIQVGMGARPQSVQKVYTQGDYVDTGNHLDMAIEGKGFFKVMSGDEELYTRAGNFTLDRRLCHHRQWGPSATGGHRTRGNGIGHPPVKRYVDRLWVRG